MERELFRDRKSVERKLMSGLGSVAKTIAPDSHSEKGDSGPAHSGNPRQSRGNHADAREREARRDESERRYDRPLGAPQRAHEVTH